MRLCSMNYNEYKNNIKSFGALIGLSPIPFSYLLPCFEQSVMII